MWTTRDRIHSQNLADTAESDIPFYCKDSSRPQYVKMAKGIILQRIIPLMAEGRWGQNDVIHDYRLRSGYMVWMRVSGPELGWKPISDCVSNAEKGRKERIFV